MAFHICNPEYGYIRREFVIRPSVISDGEIVFPFRAERPVLLLMWSGLPLMIRDVGDFPLRGFKRPLQAVRGESVQASVKGDVFRRAGYDRIIEDMDMRGIIRRVGGVDALFFEDVYPFQQDRVIACAAVRVFAGIVEQGDKYGKNRKKVIQFKYISCDAARCQSADHI